jgi:fermentation-respiration switch protein FrsA (DUF1100 family)
VLDKVHREVDKAGQVEAVKPDNGPGVAALLVGTLFAVVVPVPGRRDDDVARPHGHPPPVHRREAALALDDETAGKGRVPVRGRRLARLHQLQTGVQRVGCVRRL